MGKRIEEIVRDLAGKIVDSQNSFCDFVIRMIVLQKCLRPENVQKVIDAVNGSELLWSAIARNDGLIIYPKLPDFNPNDPKFFGHERWLEIDKVRAANRDMCQVTRKQLSALRRSLQEVHA